MGSCSRCKNGEETPLHLLSECEPLGDLRRKIFGRADLVGPGEIPDFSEFKAYQLISFFREAKFDTLTMHPFLAQYLPTEKPGNSDNQSMIMQSLTVFDPEKVFTEVIQPQLYCSAV